MTTDRNGDRFDGDLRRFLDVAARESRGTPSLIEMTARVAEHVGGTMQNRSFRSSSLALAALVILLVALIAVVLGGGLRRTVIVALPSPSPSPAIAKATQPPTSPSPSPVEDVCSAPVVMTPAFDVLLTENRDVVGPANGRVAFAAIAPNGTAGIWLETGGSKGVRVAATIATAPYAAVLGWSNDGSAILVVAGFIADQNPGPDCTDLFLVQADGSSVRKLTTSQPDHAAAGGALAPDGRTVAYYSVDHPYKGPRTSQLWLTDASGSSRVLDATPRCGADLAFGNQPSERIVWAPDGRRLAVICEGGITLYTIADGSSTSVPGLRYSAQSPEAANCSWTADGSQLLVEADPFVEGPISLLAIDPDTGETQVESVSSVSTRNQNFPAADVFSPDGKWLLVQRSPGAAVETYLIDVGTGAARRLADNISPDTAWLPDSSAFVSAGGDTKGDIIRIGLDGRSALFGSLPTPGSLGVGAYPVTFGWYFPGT